VTGLNALIIVLLNITYGGVAEYMLAHENHESIQVYPYTLLPKPLTQNSKPITLNPKP
jgi:hypothetical protein